MAILADGAILAGLLELDRPAGSWPRGSCLRERWKNGVSWRISGQPMDWSPASGPGLCWSWRGTGRQNSRAGSQMRNVSSSSSSSGRRTPATGWAFGNSHHWACALAFSCGPTGGANVTGRMCGRGRVRRRATDEARGRGGELYAPSRGNAASSHRIRPAPSLTEGARRPRPLAGGHESAGGLDRPKLVLRHRGCGASVACDLWCALECGGLQTLAGPSTCLGLLWDHVRRAERRGSADRSAPLCSQPVAGPAEDPPGAPRSLGTWTTATTFERRRARQRLLLPRLAPFSATRRQTQVCELRKEACP